MSPPQAVAGPLEIKILGILQTEAAPLSVGDIRAKLKSSGETLAYTTVMTVLVRLFEKGYLKRVKEGRHFCYELKPGGGGLGGALLNKLKRSLFGKENLKPVLALIGDEGDMSLEDLKSLRAVIDARIKNDESLKKGRS